jgi:chlorite dismutase
MRETMTAAPADPAGDTPSETSGRPPRRGLEAPDIAEKGGLRDGRPQRSDERLYMQLLAFGGCVDARPLGRHLEEAGVTGAVYEDLNDPRGVAVLALSRRPEFFLDRLRPALSAGPFEPLKPNERFRLFGRTYSLGYEPDLDEVLFRRPARTVLNREWPWAVWYPLRRSGRFARLAPEEQRAILAEHGAIGMAFGAADLAHDIRLACHGLDVDDNDFVVGLVGKDLHPLSAVVQAMRKTQQTSLYLDRLGPFFVGRAVWQT